MLSRSGLDWSGETAPRAWRAREFAALVALCVLVCVSCEDAEFDEEVAVSHASQALAEPAASVAAEARDEVILDSGEFGVVESGRNGVAEYVRAVEWRMTEGIGEPLRDRPVYDGDSEPVRAVLKDPDGFTQDGVLYDSNGMAHAYIDLVGIYDEMMSAAGPRDQTATDAGMAARELHREFRRRWVEEQRPRMQEVLAECGVEVREICWSSATVSAEVDQRMYDCLVRSEFVDRVSLSETPEIVQDAAGAEMRDAIRAITMNNLGLNGQFGSKRAGGGPLRIAIVDVSPFNPLHPVWLTGLNGSGRLVGRFQCVGGGSCDEGGDMSTAWGQHGTQMAFQAVGSLLQGQATGFPGGGTAAQHDRSGVATQAEFYYYQAPAFRDALEHMRDETRPDVISVSLAFNCGATAWCDASADCNSVNGVIRDLVDDGTVIFQAAGNNATANPAECRVLHPGFRTEVVAVGNLSFLEGSDYGASVRRASSGRGVVSTRLNSNESVSTVGVDIMMPGSRRFVPSGLSGFHDANGSGGTSTATPRAAAMAALLRQSLSLITSASVANNARYIMVNLLLSGDASDGTASGYSMSSVTRDAGFGRFHAQWFNNVASGVSSPFLGAPWKWGTNAFPVTQGNTTAWQVGGPGPESTLTTEYRLAVLWDEEDLLSTNDIVVEVWNTCPTPAGSPPVWIMEDSSYNLTKRIVLNASQVAGNCLEVRLRGYQVDGTAYVYVADMLRSGTPEWQ